MHPIVRAHELIVKMLEESIDELEKAFYEDRVFPHEELYHLHDLLILYNKTCPIEPSD